MLNNVDEMTERMLDDAGIGAGMRVLDIGCGPGMASFMLSRRVGHQGQERLGNRRRPNAWGDELRPLLPDRFQETPQHKRAGRGAGNYRRAMFAQPVPIGLEARIGDVDDQEAGFVRRRQRKSILIREVGYISSIEHSMPAALRK